MRPRWFDFLIQDNSCATTMLSFRQPSTEALSLAKQNVERYYAVVGYVEKLPQFLEVLQTTMPQFFTNITQFYSK